MWRWTKRVLAGVVGLAFLASLGATYQWLATSRDLAATPPPGQLVDIGGYRLHLWCMGAGAPAVVLESGLGGGAFTWSQVQKDTATFTRVCAYRPRRTGIQRSVARSAHERPDRAGTVSADRAERARRPGRPRRRVVRRRRRALQAEHRELVAGRPRTRTNSTRTPGGRRREGTRASGLKPSSVGRIGLLRLRGETLGLRPELAHPSVRPYLQATAHRASRYRATYDELMAWPESEKEVAASRRTLDIPLVVLTAGLSAGRRGCHPSRAAAGFARALDPLVPDDRRAVRSRDCRQRTGARRQSDSSGDGRGTGRASVLVADVSEGIACWTSGHNREDSSRARRCTHQMCVDRWHRTRRRLRVAHSIVAQGTRDRHQRPADQFSLFHRDSPELRRLQTRYSKRESIAESFVYLSRHRDA